MHQNFSKRYDNILKKSNRANVIKSRTASQLNHLSLAQDPEGRMHMDIEMLQNKTYKRQLGTSDWRLISFLWKYEISDGNTIEIVLPVYLSEDLRADFNYDDVDWNEPLRILNDLREGSLEEFMLWDTDGETINRKEVPI